MAGVHTVRGVIEAEELGITYGHEHLLGRLPAPFDEEDPDRRLDDEDAAARELGNFRIAGGSCLVEMTTAEMGRQAQALLEISKNVGVHLVAATGYHKGLYCDRLVEDLTVEQLAIGMVKDLTIGMDGTSVCAGVIKVASGEGHFTAGEEKVFAAAAEAHKITGAPISTHNEMGSQAVEQVRRLTAAGVRPERILIGHVDRRLDGERLRDLAKSGVFIGIDQIGKERAAPDALRIHWIQQLIQEGYLDQILLSGDMARRSAFPSYGFGSGPGLTFILWRFVPWMIECGVSREAVECMLVKNPARFLTWGRSG